MTRFAIYSNFCSNNHISGRRETRWRRSKYVLYTERNIELFSVNTSRWGNLVEVRQDVTSFKMAAVVEVSAKISLIFNISLPFLYSNCAVHRDDDRDRSVNQITMFSGRQLHIRICIEQVYKSFCTSLELRGQ